MFYITGIILPLFTLKTDISIIVPSYFYKVGNIMGEIKKLFRYLFILHLQNEI